MNSILRQRIDDNLLRNLDINELVKRYPEISRFRLGRMQFEADERMRINNPNEYKPRPKLPSPIVDGNLLVGLTIGEAEEKYQGIDICPCKIDGESRMILAVYCIARHIVEIENGIITKYIQNG